MADSNVIIGALRGKSAEVKADFLGALLFAFLRRIPYDRRIAFMDELIAEGPGVSSAVVDGMDSYNVGRGVLWLIHHPYEHVWRTAAEVFKATESSTQAIDLLKQAWHAVRTKKLKLSSAHFKRLEGYVTGETTPMPYPAAIEAVPSVLARESPELQGAIVGSLAASASQYFLADVRSKVMLSLLDPSLLALFRDTFSKSVIPPYDPALWFMPGEMEEASLISVSRVFAYSVSSLPRAMGSLSALVAYCKATLDPKQWASWLVNYERNFELTIAAEANEKLDRLGIYLPDPADYRCN